MIRSFQGKILALFIGLTGVALVTTALAVLAATKESVREQAQDELSVGMRVLHQLMASRGDTLLTTVQVLTEDFGFRQALAAGDRETITSALANHGARVDADVVMLASLDGVLSASTHHDPRRMPAFPFPELLAQARADGSASSTVVLQGRPYQIVIVPVKAPVPLAWVTLGFAIDDALAAQIKSLTNLEVSFRAESVGDKTPFMASTLTKAPRRMLMKTLGLHDLVRAGGAPAIVEDADFMTLASPVLDTADAQVSVALQSSMSAALQPYHSLRDRLIALSAGALALSVCGAVVLGRGITRPVRELATAARQIGRGDYNVAVNVRTRDEIGVLAATLATMQHNLAEREARIIYQAQHDELTGLPNRAVAADRLSTAIARAKRAGETFAVLMFDVNRFKEINDTLGHHIGDRVLQEVARRVRAKVREADTAIRLGGDELLVILEAANEIEATTVANKLSMALETIELSDDLHIKLSLSTGLALYPDHGATPTELLRRVDNAMYSAKAARASLAVYELGMDEHNQRQIKLIHDLREAIANDQLLVYYQPKVCLSSKRVTQAEALVRWQHPELGFIRPDEFIHLAEGSGNIGALTDWVIKSVVRQCRAWRDRGIELSVSVNVSAHDLLDSALPERILASLREHALEPACLILEVTESAVMRDAEFAIQVLHRLRDSGVRLSIDDFGTGYSSLAQLKRLPIHELKIDKSFVMELTETGEDAVIVRSTIELAHNMGLEVIAEGVETREGWALLESYRCDMLQGYFISRPLPTEQFTQWLGQYSAADGESKPLPSPVATGQFWLATG